MLERAEGALNGDKEVYHNARKDQMSSTEKRKKAVT